MICITHPAGGNTVCGTFNALFMYKIEINIEK